MMIKIYYSISTGGGVAPINAAQIEEHVTHLQDRWGPIPMETPSNEVSMREYDKARQLATDEAYLGSAHAWIIREPADVAPRSSSMPRDANPDDPQALLIVNRGSTDWDLPGGGWEPGESFEDTIHREVAEEVSLEIDVTDCFLLRRPEIHSPDDGRPVHLLQVFFDARYRGGHVRLQQAELDGAVWFATPPSDCSMLPITQRRARDFF